MKFTAILELGGKTATGIVVPPEVVEALGAGRRPPVKVTLKGYTYRSTIAVMGGEYLVGVSAEVRERAGVVAGDSLEVDIELDTEPREVAVPADLAAALEKEPDLKAAFAGLSYTYRKEYARSLEEAKAPETRVRRLEKILHALRQVKK